MLLSLDAQLSPLIASDLIVDFSDGQSARKYVDYIQKMRRQSTSKVMGLRVSQGRDRGRDNTYIEMSLPTDIGEITRSEDVPGGFYFTIWDQETAREWVDNLVIWEFVEDSKNKVFVSKEVDADVL